MAAARPNMAGNSRNLFLLLLLSCVVAAVLAARAKTSHRTWNTLQDQPARPLTSNRYRRNFVGDSSGFPGFSSGPSIRRPTSSYSSRKGGSRNFVSGSSSFSSSSGGFSSNLGFGGGPDAFLSAVTTNEPQGQDEEPARFGGSQAFGGSAGFADTMGFSAAQSFGGSSSFPRAKGGIKGGIKGRPSRPSSSSSSGFNRPASSRFFDGPSGSSSTGNRFGVSSGSFSNSRPGSSESSSGRTTFTGSRESGNSSPEGVLRNALDGIDLSSIEVEEGINLPPGFDMSSLADLLMGGDIEETSTKPPNRLILDDERNKVWSGTSNEDQEAEMFDDEFDDYGIGPVGAQFSRRPITQNFNEPYSRKGRDPECDGSPPTPENSKMQCSNYAGCRAVCNPKHLFPNGEKRIYFKCENGRYVIKGANNDFIPNCEPVCNPECKNNGICLQPNVCRCPDNFEGDYCEKPKLPSTKTCRGKPPTPRNSRIMCGRNECVSQCHEGYQFAEDVVRLAYHCEEGNWQVRDKRFASQDPHCEPLTLIVRKRSIDDIPSAICDPVCQNGGRCLAPDVCECTPDFRGDHCEHPITNCAPKNMGFNGGYNCSGEGIDFGCTLYCPERYEFTSPPARLYKCNYATGTWSPMPIPRCERVSDSILGNFVTSMDMDMSWGRGNYPNGFEELAGQLKSSMIRKHQGICTTWSGAHYNTFDGKIYSFQSGCPYTLLQDATSGHTFSVNIRNGPDCSGVSCPKAIHIFLEDEEYLLYATQSGIPVLQYKESSLAIPGHMNGVVTERVAHFVVLKIAAIGLNIKWDLKDMVITEVSAMQWNRTNGLCGRLDDSPNNDWGYADGSTERNLEAFLHNWRVKTLGEICSTTPITQHPCSGSWQTGDASTFCSKIKTDPRFEQCRQLVDVEAFISACRWDYCSAESSSFFGTNSPSRENKACNSISAFFRECTNKNGQVEGGWRSAEFCPMECNNGMQYKQCMAAYPSRCGQTAYLTQPEFCVEGCDCPEGLVRHEDLCIPVDDCPCTYRNKTYSTGQTIPNDCNSCTCMSGEWMCTEVKCGSRCASVGDPHYTTFDGRRFDFMGHCSYYLVKADEFSIEAENVPCAGAISEVKEGVSMSFPSSVANQFPSCTKSLTIRYSGTVIHLKQGKAVTVNNLEILDLPRWMNKAYIKKASSLFIVVELPNGIEVWWDGETRAYVDAPANLRGQTAGLCGTFTDNQKDDFLSPEGDVEQNPIAFANKWKTSEKCPDMTLNDEIPPCERHVQNKGVAEKLCAKIKSETFSGCHLEVDPEAYYRDCLYDLCSCESKLESCLCPILASYSKECARKGLLVDWRAEIRECGIHCTGGQKYQVCGNSCQHSCLDIAENRECNRKCAEGCNCMDGFTLNADDICVPISECPCIYANKEFKAGYEMFQNNPDGSIKVCECNNAQWNCREPTPIELESEEFFRLPQEDCKVQNHERYTECMPHEERTCKTMHILALENSGTCRPGCICHPGYVRDPNNGKCIKHQECPCHHGGRSYSENDIIQEECNTCTCNGGEWSCTEYVCPGICTAWGDSHYKTFDGRMYDFHGTCDYLLAKGKSSSTDTFEVTIQNVPCGTEGVTCAKSVILRVGSGSNQEIVELARNKPIPTRNMSRTIIREAGVFVFAEVTDLGLVLQWDKGTRAYIRLDPTWKGKVRGLCGNYNDDELDDFRTPSGGTNEVSARIFGDSWRLQNYCPESLLIKDTCSLHPHRKVWANERCSILKSNVFQSCHSEVPVEPYLERCLFDTCGCNTGGDCHCLCTAIATYAHECNIHGVYISWRTPSICPMQCDESCEHYEPCIPTCPFVTCDTLNTPKTTVCDEDVCVEGCAKDLCPRGEIHLSLTDKECVPETECERKCMEIDGEVYLEGDLISQDDCHSCYCSKMKKKCVGTPCSFTDSIFSTPFTTSRVTVPTTPKREYAKGCKTGWSVWINQDHPIISKKNSDIESIPQKTPMAWDDSGMCTADMFSDIKCRTVGNHQPFSNQAGVSCNLYSGLRCDGPVTDQEAKACRDYEISLYCDCSREQISTPEPEIPATPPPIITPHESRTTVAPSTCDAEGWSNWMSLHRPNAEGEFETVKELIKEFSLCPDHYISDVECRPTRGGELEEFVTCDSKGATCRNNAGLQYCTDYEIRIFCECECQDGLGMTDGSIKNDQITSSSHRSPDDKGQFGRVGSQWGWTSQIVNQNDKQAIMNEWIQVDLEEIKEVTGIVTQGHHYYNQWVEEFAVQVSKTGAYWEDVKDDEDDEFAKKFNGNIDKQSMVTNIFPKAYYARYVRIIPISFYGGISMRLELKGCDYEEEFPIIPEVSPGVFPAEPACIGGWTEWMNSHTPNPSNWDDIENINSLRMNYDFCDAHFITEVECQTMTVGLPYDMAGQNKIICNANLGLQCNDDLQSPDHCFDYNIRFFCDCSITTSTSTIPPTTTPVTTTSSTEAPETCRPGQLSEIHTEDCRKYYECEKTSGGWLSSDTWTFNIKTCEEGEWFHPRNLHCTSESIVEPFRPECRGQTVPEVEECIEEWSDWFNVSHPSIDGGDFETIEKIKEQGFAICDKDYIQDIECKFNRVSKPTSKGGSKGGCKRTNSCKGNPDRYTTSLDVSQSLDHLVTCSRDTGLVCRNSHQVDFRRSSCEDYAIRVLCGCKKYTEKKTKTTAIIDVPKATPPTHEEIRCVEGWSEWYNVSHPLNEEGDFETYENIQSKGFDICEKHMISQIECQYNQVTQRSSSSKGGRKTKGRVSSRGYTIVRSNVTESQDVLVTCSRDTGLLCRNSHQAHNRRSQCEDYAIRVYCECRPVSTETTTQIITTKPICGWLEHFDSNALPCDKVCHYHKHSLRQTGACLLEGDGVGACISGQPGSLCPPGQYLRDGWPTCVQIEDCTCRLKDGAMASPGRSYTVGCEVCQCKKNELICDDSACPMRGPTTSLPQTLKPVVDFRCDAWSSWVSVSYPDRQGEREELNAIRVQYPELCDDPIAIECRIRGSHQSAEKANQIVECLPRVGLRCQHENNLGGCKDYEVRFYCPCSRYTLTPYMTTTPPTTSIDPWSFTDLHPVYYPKVTDPPTQENCTRPYWTEYFNISNSEDSDNGDFELIDELISKNFDICPKAYIEKIECGFYKETRVSSKGKGGRKGSKGGFRSTSVKREYVSYTESDDFGVTCSRKSGLTCSDSLQTRTGRCQDYSIRVYCSCDVVETLPPPGKTEKAPSTTVKPLPTIWLNTEECHPLEEYAECAMKCDRVCMFYSNMMKVSSSMCQNQRDCLPGCKMPGKEYTCDDGYFLQNNNTCVQIYDCTCRLPNGNPLKPGIWYETRTCERCMCSNNQLLCEVSPDCYQVSTERYEVMTEATTPSTYPTIQVQDLFRCDEWTAYINNKRTGQGDFQLLSDLRQQYPSICANPSNVSCRAVTGKMAASDLGQVLTCDTNTGLICNNADNIEECYDYEISIYCACDFPSVTKAPEITTRGIITTLAPCDAWSPWINDHHPWPAGKGDDREHKTLKNLQDQYGFCNEGQLARIEYEAVSTDSSIVDYGVTSSVKFGLYCNKENQKRGSCLDYKVRYYCTCDLSSTTTVLVPAIYTPPPICQPDKYIKLLKDVPDSQFSATSSMNLFMGPQNARLNPEDSTSEGETWTAGRAEIGQYIQVNLGSSLPVYGLEVGGSILTGDFVKSYTVQVSNDDFTYHPILNNMQDPYSGAQVLRGPYNSNTPQLQLFSEPVETQYIRIIPKTWSGNRISLAFEVIGCETPGVDIVVIPECEEPMGIENGQLYDGQITVSSVLNNNMEFYGPKNVRLNTESVPGLTAGAWVAQSTQQEYIRFDFQEASKLSGVSTQGREDADDWVESFTVHYSPDAESWAPVTDKSGNPTVFRGNYDRETVVKHEFDRLINARYLELRPETWKNNIAMRVEVHGCFHPYDEVTESSTTTLAFTPPPPPRCTPCPGLPTEYYSRCRKCMRGQLFNGVSCVPEALCSCYVDGNRYDVGAQFENSKCEECECNLNGQVECKKKECPPCGLGEQWYLTPWCGCLCKSCPPGTQLCPSNNYCLDTSLWCDGVEDCPDDEIDCPSTPTPVCPSPPFCPGHFILAAKESRTGCPVYTCIPPTTPPTTTLAMPCPKPVCPQGFDLSFTPKQPYEMCDRYDCIPKPTTIAPLPCPERECPEGYQVVDVVSQGLIFGNDANSLFCPDYECLPKDESAICPPPQCPERYEIIEDQQSILDSCPAYECTVIVTTTVCPLPACPDGMQLLYIRDNDTSSVCQKYTCILVTTTTPKVTPIPTPAPCEHRVPVCSAGEEIYQSNPVTEPCPKFSCKKIGKEPTTTTMAPEDLITRVECKIDGRNFKTFDGSFLNVEPCNHILAKDKIENDWSISIHNKCNISGICSYYLRVNQDREVYELNPNLTITWDENEYTVNQIQQLSSTKRNFTVSLIGNSVNFKSEMYGFYIEWDIDMNLRIGGIDDQEHKVYGLCGFYTRRNADDKTKPDGSLAVSTQDFANSWTVQGDKCEKDQCSKEENAKAYKLCIRIESDPFSSCHNKVKTSGFLNGCLKEVCDCLNDGNTEEECQCQAIGRYVKQCLEADPNVPLDGWKVATKCYTECGPGEVYHDCFKANCENTCQNIKQGQAACPDRDGRCVSGCFCAPGLVRKDNKCVSPELCRDCRCEGYGDSHYVSFDRYNFTFNGLCSYVAARDKNPTGNHVFQVITTHIQESGWNPQRVFTDAITILYDSHTVLLEGKDNNTVVVKVDEKYLTNFPQKMDWLTLERHSDYQVAAVIAAIQLEVIYSTENYGFSIKLPSSIYYNKTEGLCGNCDFDPSDLENGNSPDLDTKKWLIESDKYNYCPIKTKKTCDPLPPPEDPCLSILDPNIFGKCHLLEDPAAYVSSCQVDVCAADDPRQVACDTMETYTRRCTDLGICIDNWPTDICPKNCSGGKEYITCAFGCVKTCENYEELSSDPSKCQVSDVTGCFCPDDLVLLDGQCVNKTYCQTCDTEGHRMGDIWKTDNCTTCECTEQGKLCKTKSCPEDPFCDDQYRIVEVPGSEDDCCGPRMKCELIPPIDCPPLEEPKEDCAYGQRRKKIEAPGVCPVYACICLSPEDCPQVIQPEERDLKPGEVWSLDSSGCCDRYVRNCSGECPQPECEEFLNPNIQPKLEGQCCPDFTCDIPLASCIHEYQYIVEDGKERALHEFEDQEKELYQVGDKWNDGLCLECECLAKSDGNGRAQCSRKTCQSLSDHPDRQHYELKEVIIPNKCCPKIVREACIDDYETFQVNDTIYDTLNACRSVECVLKDDDTVEKVEKMFSCDDQCPIGWKYEPSPLFPQICCGECVQIACVADGNMYNEGESWRSDDGCITYTCIKDLVTSQMSTRTEEIKCQDPTEEELLMYTYEETKDDDQCCKVYTRTSCLVNGQPLPAGDETTDPTDKCISVVCETGRDGNVTRREKEKACNTQCALGQTYVQALPSSPECCGQCIATHCVADGELHQVGDTWESEGDVCHEYTCDLRDDSLVTMVVKKTCPYFDPNCPENEIYLDESKCCKLCNVTTTQVGGCEPEAMSPEDTIGLFTISARTLGTCKNNDPVPGFRRCKGYCESGTNFRIFNRQGKHMSQCFCCQPSKLSKISVNMKCEVGYSFSRIYENVDECKCQLCEGEDRMLSDQPEDRMLGDQPILDDTEFYEFAGEDVEH